MDEYVMSAGRARELLCLLDEHGVQACVGGGWAVDALLGEQTRPHADLDVWVPAGQLDRLFVAFAGAGVDRILPWPGDRPWNFVLYDGVRCRVDLHLYEPRDDAALHYGSAVGGVTFPAGALTGRGVIAGQAVRCETAVWSVRCHTGYPPRPADRHDVPLLCERFGIELPAAFRT
jgi:lincosamide nucleotidyltransferase A/C/D/E